MTPVQHKVLTEMKTLTDDCLVQAKTGTGKTIAFLLPALQTLLKNSNLPKGQVGVLVLSPTRELALQIAKECDQLTASLNKPIECHTAFGGTQRATALKKFNSGSPSVLVATPGRLKDYLSDPAIQSRFSNMQCLILDEADTMLERGFLADVKRILETLPPKSSGWQGMCFSATVPDKIQDVIHNILRTPYAQISTVDKNEAPTAVNVPQFSLIVPSITKQLPTLLALVNEEYKEDPENFKVIVFNSTANGAALLYHAFRNLIPGLKTWQIQSRMNQNARTLTTEEFKEAKTGILFASDVVGRGMDFPNVSHVIQVGVPMSSEQYIHRVGRTARAGNSGRAIILLTQDESSFVQYNRTFPIKPYPVKISAEATALEPAIEQQMAKVDPDVKRKAYQAFLGFNKDNLRQHKGNKEAIVQIANDFAFAMGCDEIPMVEKRIVGKMGLKGVKGLNIGTDPGAGQGSHAKGRGGGEGRMQNQNSNAGNGLLNTGARPGASGGASAAADMRGVDSSRGFHSGAPTGRGGRGGRGAGGRGRGRGGKRPLAPSAGSSTTDLASKRRAE
ncbi:DEAD-domain-containing protein [Aulographum hederae CBS 113979]|uniref:ATP-dependent RNA helicase n=1 Tax=Aulographum hederae CBS 113979 TaxID=1176131 RepID=A0A6G1HEV2_9PEZI|nr:DEAD-domain-containing protein [Aulographum hederae CBS 113979]